MYRRVYLPPPWPALLCWIGARVEEHEFIQIPLEGDRPMKNRHRGQAAIVFLFPLFLSAAEFEVDAIARVLDDRSFEPHRRDTDLDNGRKTGRFWIDGAFDRPLDRPRGTIAAAASDRERGDELPIAAEDRPAKLSDPYRHAVETRIRPKPKLAFCRAEFPYPPAPPLGRSRRSALTIDGFEFQAQRPSLDPRAVGPSRLQTPDDQAQGCRRSVLLPRRPTSPPSAQHPEGQKRGSRRGAGCGAFSRRVARSP
jgi:hypothetical protein